MGNQTLERSQDMKTALLLLTFVAFACEAPAVVPAVAEADPNYWIPPTTPNPQPLPHYYYGRKKRQAEAAPTVEANAHYGAYPYYGYRHYYGRKKRQAEADPKAEADPWYGYYWGSYGYSHYGYGYPYLYNGRKRRQAEADPKNDPLYGYYGHYGYYPYYRYGYLYGRKRREAQAEPEAEADPKADPWYGYYGHYLGGYYGLGHSKYPYGYRYFYG